MHRCLSIPDIVGEVCSHVYTRFPWYHAGAAGAGGVTLATLARTSSVFQGPALDLLWFSQNTLENFLRCLPPDLVAFDKVKAGLPWKRKVVVRLLRPIVSSDWDRSRLYAHRVRELYCAGDSFSLSQSFPALSISLPDDVLFPNLRELTWQNFPEGDFHHINLYLARTLTEISIWPSSAFQLSVLSTLPRRCPALETLEIHLQFLQISVDDIATLEVIGKLQNLQNLTLSGLPGHLSFSVLDTVRFSNARRISLIDVTPKAATEFFKMCMGASLTSVDVGFDSHPRTSALTQFCSALESCHHSHLSLTSLFLAYDPPIEGNIASYVVDSATYAVDSATFRILFCFENLTKVSVREVSFDLDDAFLMEMARSWPRLESLRLSPHAPPQPTHVTLHSLRSLARHCPDLRELEMTFDASVIPPPDTSGAHVLQTSLTTIWPGCSPILAPFQVARFISGIFPCLYLVKTSCSDDDIEEVSPLTEEVETWIDQWSEVESHIPTIMAIREEGRMWAQSSIRPPTPTH
ncbi:hypothetical protein DFH09DRAFT_1007960 [Mycena vulgaris]|nr:hypothetical protein DFH09DRAFT_1007960 [Mycena vulgaris]